MKPIDPLVAALLQHPLLCSHDYDDQLTYHFGNAAEIEGAGSVEEAEVNEDVENSEVAAEVEEAVENSEASLVAQGLRSKQSPWGERSSPRTPPCRHHYRSSCHESFLQQSKVHYLQPTPPEEPPPAWLLSKAEYTRLLLERPGVIKTVMWRNMKTRRKKTSIDLTQRHFPHILHKLLHDAASVLRWLWVYLPLGRIAFESRDSKAVDMDVFVDKYAVKQSRQDTLRSTCASYLINTKPLLHPYRSLTKPFPNLY